MGTFERKSMPMVAWYMLSKESYMKRVMREVLPTEEVWDQLYGHMDLKRS